MPTMQLQKDEGNSAGSDKGEKGMGFFRGRYGNDQFGIFLFIISLIIEIIGRIAGIRIIYYIGLLLFIYMFARMFSRNIYKRQNENMAYLNIRNKILNWKYFSGQRRQQRRQGRMERKQARQDGFGERRGGRRKDGGQKIVYCYYYCPQCKQQVRIPAGKGKVRVKCPRCGDVFDAVS